MIPPGFREEKSFLLRDWWKWIVLTFHTCRDGITWLGNMSQYKIVSRLPVTCAALAGGAADTVHQLSPAARSGGTTGRGDSGSNASGTDAAAQRFSASGSETPATASGSGAPFVEPVLQSAEEYYRARGIIPQGQPGTEAKPDSAEDPSRKSDSRSAAFVEPRLQSAEEYYRARGIIGQAQPEIKDNPDMGANGPMREVDGKAAAFVEPRLQPAEEYYKQLGLISGEAPLAQEEAGESEAEAAAGDGEQDSEEEPSWNVAASGKGTGELPGDAAGSAALADARQEEQAAARDPVEPLEIVLDEDAGELPAAWYNDVPRLAGAPEEPSWNAAGKARVIVRKQTAKEGEGAVSSDTRRHLLHLS